MAERLTRRKFLGLAGEAGVVAWTAWSVNRTFINPPEGPLYTQAAELNVKENALAKDLKVEGAILDSNFLSTTLDQNNPKTKEYYDTRKAIKATYRMIEEEEGPVIPKAQFLGITLGSLMSLKAGQHLIGEALGASYRRIRPSKENTPPVQTA